MLNYQVFIAEEYDKQLKKMSKSDRTLIEKKMKEYVIPQLQSEPYTGKNPLKLAREICAASPSISTEHIGYLGIELEKVSQCLNTGKNYVQD